MLCKKMDSYNIANLSRSFKTSNWFQRWTKLSLIWGWHNKLVLLYCNKQDFVGDQVKLWLDTGRKMLQFFVVFQKNKHKEHRMGFSCSGLKMMIMWTWITLLYTLSIPCKISQTFFVHIYVPFVFLWGNPPLTILTRLPIKSPPTFLS